MTRLVIATLATASLACCQDASSLLAKVAQRYQSLDGFHVEGTYGVSSTRGGGSTSKFVIEGEEKNRKLHVQFKSEELEMELFSDGSTTWTYLPHRGIYTQVDAVATENGDDTPAASDLVSRLHDIVLGYYEKLKPNPAWQVTGEKQVKTADGKVRCYLIEAKIKDQTQKIWIDEDQNLVLRSESTYPDSGALVGISTSLKRFDATAPAESAFVFHPSNSDKRVDDLPLPGYAPSFVGKQASDFALKDLDGNVVHLRDLRGKIVMLDFWATWCPPCRRELPTIQNLAQELKDKDVVVLGVNDEGASKVRDFYKTKSYTFTTLEDTSGKIHVSYAAREIPTVFIIGRDGVIVRHLIGGREHAELMNALKEAGLNQ